MKYVLAFLGMFIGTFLGGLVFDGNAVPWILGLGLGLFGYMLPGFMMYQKMTPKKLLAFHGVDSLISRSRSLREIKAFMSQLHDGGLLRDFNFPSGEFDVDDLQWQALNEDERNTLMQILGRARELANYPNSVSRQRSS